MLEFKSDIVTSSTCTSIIPTPVTSPIFIGEFPSKKSPFEDDNANTVPFIDADA
ncbi:hypothetical protein D3C71_2010510 [compost metagenome]